MRAILRLHPDAACETVSGIAVEADRPAPGRLALRYSLAGDAAALAVPPPAEPIRTDELWRHTCFEAFLRAPGAAAYIELNLAPSGQWAAYRFDGYRSGMAPADIPPPAIEWTATADGFQLCADLDLSGLLPPGGDWQAGLTAVVEETSGRTHHWALAHPAGRADFHHDDGFALTLPGPEPS